MSAFSAPHPYFIGTSEQSRKLDSDTINSFGVGSFTLMETAGYSAAQKLLAVLRKGQQGVYLCGKGNNAGDALVIARYLVQHGIGATLVFLSGTDALSPDTRKNFELLNTIAEMDNGVSVTVCTSWHEFDTDTEPDFIIDGMLGTGLSSDLRGDYIEAVQWTNDCDQPVYAVDIPTGIHGDSGALMGMAVRADVTYAFGNLKQGFYLDEGPAHTGSVVYCELPFPNYLKKSFNTFLLDQAWVPKASPREARHKYEGGVLYVIAGSEGLTGAAMLAAESAWAAGLGAVILITPHGNLEIYEKNLPQIIKKTVGSRDDHYFKKEHLEKTLEIVAEKEGQVLLGPGIGREDSTKDFVHSFLKEFSGSVLIDADGLWALARLKEWKKAEGAEWILTPHPGELASLLERSVENETQRLNMVRDIARKNRITLLSKGFPVILGTQEGKIYLTSYDTRKFSRAGFGDVLAGKTAAYRALGHSPEHSAALALLDGKEKIDRFINVNPERTAEPKDLI